LPPFRASCLVYLFGIFRDFIEKDSDPFSIGRLITRDLNRRAIAGSKRNEPSYASVPRGYGVTGDCGSPVKAVRPSSEDPPAPPDAHDRERRDPSQTSSRSAAHHSSVRGLSQPRLGADNAGRAGRMVRKPTIWPSRFQDRSGLEIQVRASLVVDISVGWSLAFWGTVLNGCFDAVVSGILNLGGILMSNLTAIVSVGAALLPVPGWPSSTCQEV
jgi:hypothetical protein